MILDDLYGPLYYDGDDRKEQDQKDQDLVPVQIVRNEEEEQEDEIEQAGYYDEKTLISGLPQSSRSVIGKQSTVRQKTAQTYKSDTKTQQDNEGQVEEAAIGSATGEN